MERVVVSAGPGPSLNAAEGLEEFTGDTSTSRMSHSITPLEKQLQTKMFHLTGQSLLYFLKSLSRTCICEKDLFHSLLTLTPSSHMDGLHILLVVLLGNSSKFGNNSYTSPLLLH